LKRRVSERADAFEVLEFPFIERHGFLHKNRLPGRHGLLSQGSVKVMARRNQDRVNAGVIQEGAGVGKGPGPVEIGHLAGAFRSLGARYLSTENTRAS